MKRLLRWTLWLPLSLLLAALEEAVDIIERIGERLGSGSRPRKLSRLEDLCLRLAPWVSASLDHEINCPECGHAWAPKSCTEYRQVAEELLAAGVEAHRAKEGGTEQ